jgi:kynureninase
LRWSTRGAVQICKALGARVRARFRPPNVIRVAPISLYTTYDEIWQIVNALREIMETGEHERFGAARAVVS